MKIDDILKPYKYFFLARPEDNQEILSFFNSMTMDTKSLSLRYDRGNDFFSFSKEQAQDFFIFIMRDEKGTVKGTASIAIIPHFLNGKKVKCAYLGDLRISPLLNAKIRINWKKCYSDIIENFSAIDEFQGIKYLYSAILDENQNAMRSLLKNNDQIIYHHLTSYETYNVITPKFFSFTPKKYSIEETNFKEIESFLIKTSKGPGLTNFVEKSESSELSRRFHTWEGFSEKSFLSVKNSSNEIVAVFAPWKCQTKKLIIEKMSLGQKLLSFILPLLGIPPLKEKKAIDVLYLTHLTFDLHLPKAEITNVCNSILLYLFQQKRDFHMISFFTYPQWNLGSMPFFKEITKGNFYQVMSKKQFEDKDFMNLENTPPAFEIGIA